MRISDWSSDVCSSDLAHSGVIQKGVEHADGVRSAAHAGDQHVGQAALLLHDLRACLDADDGLEIAHQLGIGVRPGGRADDVERSEEHTSELQSLMRISYAVFCLKKKNKKTMQGRTTLYHLTRR